MRAPEQQAGHRRLASLTLLQSRQRTARSSGMVEFSMNGVICFVVLSVGVFIFRPSCNRGSRSLNQSARPRGSIAQAGVLDSSDGTRWIVSYFPPILAEFTSAFLGQKYLHKPEPICRLFLTLAGRRRSLPHTMSQRIPATDKRRVSARPRPTSEAAVALFSSGHINPEGEKP